MRRERTVCDRIILLISCGICDFIQQSDSFTLFIGAICDTFLCVAYCSAVTQVQCKCRSQRFMRSFRDSGLVLLVLSNVLWKRTVLAELLCFPELFLLESLPGFMP